MAMLIPAVRGTMGTTTYYQTTMPAREVVSSVRPAKELDDWLQMSIDERMQREPNITRIRNEIVPYLAKSEDRLFGALIVLVYKGSTTFEAMKELSERIPAAYSDVSKRIGFLTIAGGELIVLDGQHRLLALREIIQGDDVEGEHVSEIPSDEVSVIFIDHESNEKTRRIFNKVNRHAKPTSRGDNIITSEDDGHAIVTRRLLEDGGPLGRTATGTTGEIVNWKSNTLTKRATQLTTISAVYETVKDILAQEAFPNFDEKHRVNRPAERELDKAYAAAERWWTTVLALPPYAEALEEPRKIPGMREDGQPYSMLLKPIGQITLFKGLALVLDRGVALEEAVRRAEQLDWNISADLWRDVIVTSGGRMIGRRENYDLAAELIAYLIAPERIDTEAKDQLWHRFNRFRGYDFDDPEPGTRPEDLPKSPVAVGG